VKYKSLFQAKTQIELYRFLRNVLPPLLPNCALPVPMARPEPAASFLDLLGYFSESREKLWEREREAGEKHYV
jgi:hypothetical protein